MVQLSFSLENSWRKTTKNIKASCRLKNQREFLQFKKVQPTSRSLSKQLWIVSKKSLSTKLSTALLITFFFSFSTFHAFCPNKNSVVESPRRKKVCYREYIHSPLGDGDMLSTYKGELIDWFSSLNLCFNSTNNL